MFVYRGMAGWIWAQQYVFTQPRAGACEGFLPICQTFCQRKCHLLDTFGAAEVSPLQSCICGWLDFAILHPLLPLHHPILPHTDLSQIVTVPFSLGQLSFSLGLIGEIFYLWIYPRSSQSDCQRSLIVQLDHHFLHSNWIDTFLILRLYTCDVDEVCMCVLEKIKEIIWFPHNATRQPICSYLYAARYNAVIKSFLVSIQLKTLRKFNSNSQFFFP